MIALTPKQLYPSHPLLPIAEEFSACKQNQVVEFHLKITILLYTELASTVYIGVSFGHNTLSLTQIKHRKLADYLSTVLKTLD